MKRAILLLVVLAVLAGGVFFFLRRSAVTDGAQMVPTDSVFYASIPDLRRTAERWPKTALARIGAEPSVAEFLKKPAEVLASQGGLEGLDLLLRVKPARFFVAVTGVRENGADAVVGFEFFGSRQELDAAMDRLYRELEKSMPNAKRTTADYQGDAFTTFADGAPLLFSAVHGAWGLISNSETALKQALDRASGRDRSPTLATDEAFKTVAGNLSRDPDFLWFARVKPVFDLLVTVGEKQGGTIDRRQLAQLEKIKALGGTLQLDGAAQKEATFVLYPDGPKLPVVDRSPMAFTAPGTLFYYDSTIDWETVASDSYYQSLPPEVQGFLTNAKIDLKELPKMFGNDLGLVVNWPPSATIPAVLAVAEVKDRPRVEALATNLLAQVGVPTTGSELHGARVFGFPAGQLQLIDPALAISDKFGFLSLTGPELERALSAAPGAPTLEGSEAFKSALGSYREDAQAFGYLDTKALFEGVYNRLRPIAIFAAAMSSDVGKFVDVNKLPETEVISQHLTPIVYTTKQKDDGWLVESSGPVTLSQVVFVTVAGAGAGYLSQTLNAPAGN